jgi:hypothetical protein
MDNVNALPGAITMGCSPTRRGGLLPSTTRAVTTAVIVTVGLRAVVDDLM